MPLVTEQIVSETENTLSIKFIGHNGKEIVRTVTKMAGKTNEDLLRIWHFRMTEKYMQGAIKANRLKRTIVEEGDGSITMKYDKRVVTV